MDAKPSFSESAKAKIRNPEPEHIDGLPDPGEWPAEDLSGCASIAKDKWVTALTVKHAKGA